MKRNLVALISIFVLNSCLDKTVDKKFTGIADRISIFEIYFKEPKSVDQFGIFLRDTLKLPVEWEPFDFFGNGVVYDAAYYFGNTTLELLALSDTDSAMNESARFNRVLFESDNIKKNDEFLIRQGLQHTPPFDFNIVSDSSELQIGSQINLDSLSQSSNINIAFWQYENTGFNFTERSNSASGKEQLIKNLEASFGSNPIGIIGLKEVHLTISQTALDQWTRLLGEPVGQQWKLLLDPTIKYDIADQSIGLDRITIQVDDLRIAKEFLNGNGIPFDDENDRLKLDRSRFYGLNIWIEE